MTIRAATLADEALLRELWAGFEGEVPAPAGEAETWEEEWCDTKRDFEQGVVLLAEDDEGLVGVVRAHLPRPSTVFVHLLYVVPRSRSQGVAKALLAEVTRLARERGAERVSLEVPTSNAAARALWERLGFEEYARKLEAPLDALERRLAGERGEPTFGSLHVQTDDRDAVRRQVAKYRPRMAGRGEHEVSDARNGWVSVYDEVIERDRHLLKRYARELSYAAGAVVVAFWVDQETVVGYAIYDHGSAVDDYLSVPEFYGPVPPGDVVSLAANPRVVQRLTGADPAVVRAVARTASSPAELPPARELIAQVAAAMGIVDADRGYS